MNYISVIVPVYNAELTLQKCVNSILNQSFTNLEVVLVNDGSTDSSGAICDKYMERDSRVITVHQRNSGVSVARNTGLRIANGQYIVFIDSDDYVDEDFLSTLYKNISDLTICGFIAQNETGFPVYRIIHQRKSYRNKTAIEYADLYRNNALYSPYCKLFSKKIISQNSICFPEGISWGEDGMFVAEYLKYVTSVEVLDYEGYHYLISPDNSSLATKIREDIVDTIVLSREYCIEQMKITSSKDYDAVRMVCIHDIQNNCAYFIKKLLSVPTFSLLKKQQILERFLSNLYVQKAIHNSKEYFSGDIVIQKCLRRRSARKILWAYAYLSKLNTIKISLRKNIVRWIPERVKVFLRARRK